MIGENYIKKIREWIEPYIHESQRMPTTQSCSISIFANELRIILSNESQQAIEILLSETISFDNINNLQLILAELIKKYSLDNMPVYWLLQPEDYQLYLIESLPVPQNEFRDALTWRVRSLISYPIEEAVLDYFVLPAKKSSPDHPMIGAVIAKADQLNKSITLLKTSNISLSCIDIPELAMRNLSALYEDDEKSTAFIYMFEKITILNITRQKILYFTRRIYKPSISDATKKDYEQLSLEIMRYFDYFQSQWRYPTPSRIFIAADEGPVSEIAKQLSELLAATVEPYTLKSILLDKQKKEIIEKKYLLTLGCALREGKNNATPRN